MLIDLSKRIEGVAADVKVIRRDLQEDYKALHGNGQKGLIERVAALENRMDASHGAWQIVKEIGGWIVAIIAAALNLFIAWKSKGA